MSSFRRGRWPIDAAFGTPAGGGLTRRTLLAGGAALSALALVPVWRAPAAASGGFTTLAAREGQVQLLPADEPATAIWGFDGSVPGPLIRVGRGDEVRVRLDNRLDQPTTIHWHGVRLDNRMDGVPHLTQEPVGAGGTFDYVFTAPDAGTFWYHPHERSWEQVARGLYGILIVDEAEPPQVDQDLLVVIDDWRLGEDGQIHEASLGSMMDWAHAGRIGNVATINSADLAEFRVRAGERLRLRLCNTANARIFEFRIDGHEQQVVAVDGQPIRPFAAPSAGIVLAPGQRADLVVDASGEPGSRHPIILGSGREGVTAGHIVYDEIGIARSSPADAPIRLPANGLPATVDTASARRVALVMEGGAMSGMVEAMHSGRMMGMRELAGQGQLWALNGVSGMTDKPLFSARRGETVVIDLVNDTVWPHAMHWHGHHAFVLDGGSAERSGLWRDTLHVAPGGRASVAMIADNPGKWMLHCHMLEHQASGMDTWFEVAG